MQRRELILLSQRQKLLTNGLKRFQFDPNKHKIKKIKSSLDRNHVPNHQQVNKTNSIDYSSVELEEKCILEENQSSWLGKLVNGIDLPTTQKQQYNHLQKIQPIIQINNNKLKHLKESKIKNIHKNVNHIINNHKDISQSILQIKAPQSSPNQKIIPLSKFHPKNNNLLHYQCQSQNFTLRDCSSSKNMKKKKKIQNNQPKKNNTVDKIDTMKGNNKGNNPANELGNNMEKSIENSGQQNKKYEIQPEKQIMLLKTQPQQSNNNLKQRQYNLQKQFNNKINNKQQKKSQYNNQSLNNQQENNRQLFQGKIKKNNRSNTQQNISRIIPQRKPSQCESGQYGKSTAFISSQNSKCALFGKQQTSIKNTLFEELHGKKNKVIQCVFNQAIKPKNFLDNNQYKNKNNHSLAYDYSKNIEIKQRKQLIQNFGVQISQDQAIQMFYQLNPTKQKYLTPQNIHYIPSQKYLKIGPILTKIRYGKHSYTLEQFIRQLTINNQLLNYIIPYSKKSQYPKHHIYELHQNSKKDKYTNKEGMKEEWTGRDKIVDGKQFESIDRMNQRLNNYINKNCLQFTYKNINLDFTQLKKNIRPFLPS